MLTEVFSVQDVNLAKLESVLLAILNAQIDIRKKKMVRSLNRNSNLFSIKIKIYMLAKVIITSNVVDSKKIKRTFY